MRFGLILLFLFTFFTSCRQAEDKGRSRAGISATDDLGHVVILPAVPRRIVSLAPNITETLFALGLDSSVAGVTDYCDFPTAARYKQRVGGMLNPNIEQVLALHPDLVLMSGSGNMRTDYEKLTSSGVSVFVTFPKSIDDVLRSISVIGTLTGRSAIADTVTHRMADRRNELVRFAAQHRRKSVLLLLSLNPIVAVGAGTFLDEMLSLANSENIARAAPTAYPILSREEILRTQPGIILAMGDIVRSPDDLLRAYPEWKDLHAIQQHQVAIVDASIVSRPGPRIVDGLDSLVHAIHGVR